MTEIFRIIGKNDIHFDAGPTGNYFFTQEEPPQKLTTVLTRREVLLMLPDIPLGVRPMALKHGLSIITMELNIQGTSDTDMEAREHALIETLVETEVFFSNGGTMGTKGELQIKSDGASEVSFKSVFYGVVDELDARDVLGAVIKAHRLQGLRLTLYCEPYWRPGTFNHLFNGGFEFWDSVPYAGAGGNTEPDGWEDIDVNITGTNNREAVFIHRGTYSLKIDVTNGAGAWGSKGVQENILNRLIPGVTYTLVFWLRNTAITGGVLRVGVVGDDSGTVFAVDAAGANGAFVQRSVAFTPSTADTTLYVFAYIYDDGVAGCSGTAYLDGMMVVRGTVVPTDFIEWHPNPGIRIGPNLLSNAGFEEWPMDVTDNEPDCWDDLEGGCDTPDCENNRESIEVLQGCYALEIDVTNIDAGDLKGVTQNIETRLTADTEYVLIVWIKNTVITNGELRVRVWGSVSALLGDAFAAGIANDPYTRYVVTFTPAAGDVAGWVQAQCYIWANFDNCTGTAYIDKMMIIEASVLNGHSFAPEEWTGCGYVYNHLDKACDVNGGGGPCHVNYLDITDLRSDVDTRLRIEMESLYYDTYGVGELTVARRTDPCLPCQFVHVLESEDGAEVDWTDTADGERADCQIAWNAGADLAGHIIWDYTTLGYNLACQQGRFRVLGAVFADYDGDADENIKFRVSHGIASYQASPWLQPLIADTWHWLDFGVFEVTGQFWGNELPSSIFWRIDYVKEANDDVGLDFLLLLPEDESMLRIPVDGYFLETTDYTAATIAFAATTPGTITDTAAGLAIFGTGDKIQVMGSASNDGFYTVSTGGVAGTIRTVEETVLEALGATITIASYQDVLWDNTFDFPLAMWRDTADAFLWHPPVQAEPLALKPEEQNRLIFAIGHYMSAAFPYKGCLVHEDNDEHMLVSLKYLPQFVSPLE